MSLGLLVQYIVVALVVLVSVVVAFRKLLPNLCNRWQAAASIRLGRKRDSRLAQALSRRLQPAAATVHRCADGCATCDACGPRRPLAATGHAAAHDAATVPTLDEAMAAGRHDTGR